MNWCTLVLQYNGNIPYMVSQLQLHVKMQRDDIAIGFLQCCYSLWFVYLWRLFSLFVSVSVWASMTVAVKSCESIVPDTQCEPPRTLRMVLPSVYSVKRWSLCERTLIPICKLFSLHLLLLGITCVIQEACWQRALSEVAWSQFSLHVPRPQPN